MDHRNAFVAVPRRVITPAPNLEIGNQMESHQLKSTSETRARAWMGTLPAEQYTVNDIIDRLRPYGTVAGQEEIGESGYRHFQVYVRDKEPIRLSTLSRKFPKAHWEPARTPPHQCLAYVTKAETRVGLPFLRGVAFVPVGDELKGRSARRESLEERAHEAIVEERMTPTRLIAKHPELVRIDRQVDRIYLEWQRTMFGEKHREVHSVFIHTEPGAEPTKSVYSEAREAGLRVFAATASSMPFASYSGEDIILLNNFCGQLPIREVIDLQQGAPLELAGRYQHRIAAHTRLVVISYDRLESMYLSSGVSPAFRQAFIRGFDDVVRWNLAGEATYLKADGNYLDEVA